MMMPGIFGENLFNDDFMNFPFENDFWGNRNPLYGKHAKNMMKTDVRETNDHYEVDIDLPGFKKEEINAKLENGYLTISASKSLDKEKTDTNGKFLHQERYSGSMSRSFYIGDAYSEEDIKAKYENGILKLVLPKREAQAVEQNRYIAIEG